MVVTKQYTFADLLTLTDERIYDIWEGELVVYTSPNPRHATAVAELIYLLMDAQRAGYGSAWTAPLAVAFDFAERGVQARDVTHPDVMFVRAERRAITAPQCVEAAPDLAIEVLSPTTRRDDLPGGGRWSIYERYGVRHYWIVDTEARTIAQYVWQDDRYGEPTVLLEGDTLVCPLFPTVTRPVKDIFAGIP
jgi:Uma2 family endonuclease